MASRWSFSKKRRIRLFLEKGQGLPHANPKDPNLYPNLTDEKVRKFMGQNVEAGGDGIAGDNSVSFAEYVEGGVIVVLVVA